MSPALNRLQTSKSYGYISLQDRLNEAISERCGRMHARSAYDYTRGKFGKFGKVLSRNNKGGIIVSETKATKE